MENNIIDNAVNQLKVLLINPPQKYFNQSLGFNVYFPLGLLGIASMVRDICDVKILDCLITEFEIKRSGDFTVFGSPLDKVKECVRNYDPDIVGITTPFSSQAENAKAIKTEVNPHMATASRLREKLNGLNEEIKEIKETLQRTDILIDHINYIQMNNAG